VSDMPLTAERLAREFHAAYELLAPTFDYETKPESRTKWEQVPEQNRMLMVATAATVIGRLGLRASRPMRRSAGTTDAQEAS
jgi:hypothetical protein